jgi:hypothetical protein
MIRFHDKGIDVIKNSFAGAERGIICTPYYTERGLKLLDPFFDTAEEVEFWTRFSPLDWRAGVADMAALKQRVQSIINRKKKFTLHVSDDLHAKIYSFSNNKVIIGSANLTWPAMTTNIETVCELTNADATNLVSFLPNFKSRLTPVPIDVFIAYVTVAADAISKPSEGPAEEDEDMNAAIALAEDTLRESLVQKAPKALPIIPVEIDEFFKYCRREKTDLASEIIARGLKGKHSLQGHVKHCYYGALRFLSEHTQFVAEIAATPHESLYDFTDQVRTKWRDFLHKHAKEIDKKRDFMFRTLRVYLPPSLGGICTGGGGGSGTLKRVFPVVARMLQESGRGE